MRTTSRRFATLLALTLSVAVAHRLPAAPNPRSDTQDKTFPVKPGGRLVIAADRGSVTIEGADISEVRLEVRRKVVRGSDQAAADLLQRHEVKFSQDGDTVRLDTRFATRERWNWTGPQLEVEIRAQVPQAFVLDAMTAGGSIKASSVKGDAKLKTAGGSIRLEHLQGTLLARTSGGSIRGSHLAGTVDVSTSGGSIDLEAVRGEGLKATTSGGSIRLLKLEAPATAQTSGGSIEVESSATPLTATTSGGSIRAELKQAPKEEVVLKTSAGGITLTLPAASAFNLDAATSAGGVQTDFDMGPRNAKERSALKGEANGGGPLLKLRTSAGSIRIKTP